MDILYLITRTLPHDWKLHARINCLSKSSGRITNCNKIWKEFGKITSTIFPEQYKFCISNLSRQVLPVVNGPNKTLHSSALLINANVNQLWKLDVHDGPVPTTSAVPGLNRMIEWMNKNMKGFSTLLTRKGIDHFMITGGFASNIFFNGNKKSKEYNDIDIWHFNVVDSRERLDLDGVHSVPGYIDLVGNPLPFEKVITRFDLSVCSLGMVYNRGRLSIIYTPSLIYTSLTGSLIANYTCSNIIYGEMSTPSVNKLIRVLYYDNPDWTKITKEELKTLGRVIVNDHIHLRTGQVHFLRDFNRLAERIHKYVHRVGIKKVVFSIKIK